jgi:hypothetical protein
VRRPGTFADIADALPAHKIMATITHTPNQYPNVNLNHHEPRQVSNSRKDPLSLLRVPVSFRVARFFPAGSEFLTRLDLLLLFGVNSCGRPIGLSSRHPFKHTNFHNDNLYLFHWLTLYQCVFSA